MTKFFIILALIWLGYTYFKNASRGRPKNPNAAAQKQAEDIVPCAHCGLHIPKSDSVSANNQYFCSDAHRKAFLK